MYHALQAAVRGEHFEMSPELTEEEALQVTVILSKVEKKCQYPDIEDAMALSMVQLYHPSARHGLRQGRHRLHRCCQGRATLLGVATKSGALGLRNSLPRCPRCLLLRRHRPTAHRELDVAVGALHQPL
jgi:hypothetical protein